MPNLASDNKSITLTEIAVLQYDGLQRQTLKEITKMARTKKVKELSPEEKLDAALDAFKQEVLAIYGDPEEAAEEAEEAEEAAPAKKTKKGKAAKKTATKEQVREALMALNEAKGKQEVIDVLSRFGVSKIQDLKEENYAEVVELANAEAEDEEAEEAEDDEEDDIFG